MSVCGVVGEASPGKGLRRYSQTIEEVSDKGEGMMCLLRHVVKCKYLLLNIYIYKY